MAGEKSSEAFRTISEAAEELDLPQHVLRFWETRFNQIRPLKRGGGRRFYRPEDMDLLRGIRHLLYGEGYTIRGVQRILKEQGQRYVMGLWREGEGEPPPKPLPISRVDDRERAALEGRDPDGDEFDDVPFDEAAFEDGGYDETDLDEAMRAAERPSPPAVDPPVVAPTSVAPAASRPAAPPVAAPAVAAPLPPQTAQPIAGVRREPGFAPLAPGAVAGPAVAPARPLATPPPQRPVAPQATPARPISPPTAPSHAMTPPTTAPARPIAPPAAPVRAEPPRPEPLPSGILADHEAAGAREPGSVLGFIDRLRGAPSKPDAHVPAPAAAGALSRDDVRKLQATLFELLECKRLLDQAR